MKQVYQYVEKYKDLSEVKVEQLKFDPNANNRELSLVITASVYREGFNLHDRLVFPKTTQFKAM